MIPVCYKKGIAPYPCNSLPQLRLADGPGKGNWLCDEHYFQAKQQQLLWKEIERQSKLPSPLTEPLEITDETNQPLGVSR